MSEPVNGIVSARSKGLVIRKWPTRLPHQKTFQLIVLTATITLGLAGCGADSTQISERRQSFFAADPQLGDRLFLPGEQVVCETWWGAFGTHSFTETAESCVEESRFWGMHPLDEAANTQRVIGEINAQAEMLRQQQAAAAAQRQAEVDRQAELARQVAEQQQAAQARQEETARILRARKVDRANQAAARIQQFAAASGVATVVPTGKPPTSADRTSSSSGSSTCAPDHETPLQLAMMGASYKGGCSVESEAASSSSSGGGSVRVTIDPNWLTDDGGVNLVHVLNISSRPIKLIIWTAACVNLEVANCGYMPSPTRPLPPGRETQFTVGRDDDAQVWSYTVQCTVDGAMACGTSGGGSQNPCISTGSCAGRDNSLQAQDPTQSDQN
jgi:hypothetical protein